MPKIMSPLNLNLKFCKKAARQGARFVRVDALPNHSKREMVVLVRTVGLLLDTPKGQILTFSQRFLCEANPNYNAETDTEHQEISR